MACRPGKRAEAHAPSAVSRKWWVQARPRLNAFPRHNPGLAAHRTTRKAHVTGAREILRCRPAIFW
jgi:hypothetical protein